MFGRSWFGVVAGVLLVLAIAAGVAYFAYGAGLANGMAQGAPVGSPETGQPGTVAPYVYGPYGFWPFGFGHGLFGCLIPLLFFFLIFGAMRMLFWPHRWGWGPRGWSKFGHRGYEDWPQWMQDRVEAWHRRMHGEEPPQSSEAES